MGAECHIHGCDLGGDTHSGLRCPVCEKEKEIQSLEARATRAERELEQLRGERDAALDSLARLVLAVETAIDRKRWVGTLQKHIDSLPGKQVNDPTHPQHAAELLRERDELASRLREVEGALREILNERITTVPNDRDYSALAHLQANRLSNIFNIVHRVLAGKLSEGGEG